MEEDKNARVEELKQELWGRLGKSLPTCRHCGRLLTDRISRERGIGPECEKKEAGEQGGGE